MSAQGERFYETLEIKSKRSDKGKGPYKQLFSSNGHDCMFEYPSLMIIEDMDDDDLNTKTAEFRARAVAALFP